MNHCSPGKKLHEKIGCSLDVLYFRGTLSFQISNKKGLGLRVIMAVILQQWQTRIREELLPAKQHCQENLRAAKVAATAPKIGQDIPKPATASRKTISEGQKGNANLLIFKHAIPEVWLIFEDCHHIFWCPHQLTSCHNSPTSKNLRHIQKDWKHDTEVSLDEGQINRLVSKQILPPIYDTNSKYPNPSGVYLQIIGMQLNRNSMQYTNTLTCIFFHSRPCHPSLIKSWAFNKP